MTSAVFASAVCMARLGREVLISRQKCRPGNICAVRPRATRVRVAPARTVAGSRSLASRSEPERAGSRAVPFRT